MKTTTSVGDFVQENKGIEKNAFRCKLMTEFEGNRTSRKGKMLAKR